MGNVFISYRRAETAGEARALFKDLAAALGSDSVFMDVDTIALGRDFREIVREHLASSDIMLALVGRDWVGIKDAAGCKRLEDPKDFVRLEIEAALKRGIPVIPVLVQGAQMPTTDQLPPEIRNFTFRNAFELSHNRWESDVRELLRRLALHRQDAGVNVESAPPHPPRAKRRYWLMMAAGIVLSVGLAGFVYQTIYQDEGDRTSQRAQEAASAIREKWAAVGKEGSPLGQPVGEEVPTFDGVGRWQQFQGGIISWHPETGAHIVWGKIGERWIEKGREQFGYPITDELKTADGRGRVSEFRAVQHRQKPVASIYWSPETGAHEVFGAIRDKWTELGAERSALGYPVSPEHDQADGRLQRFQGGVLFWTPQSGVIIR